MPYQPSSQTQDAKQNNNKHRSIMLMILFDIVLPIVLYFVLKNHIQEIWALIISGVPPFIIVVYGFIRNRRVDVLGLIIVVSFIVGAIVASLKDDPRLY